MQVAHLLRKYNPLEWGGTETAIKRLCDGLIAHQVRSLVFCPRLEATPEADPLAESGHEVRRFRACVPVWGIGADQRRQLVTLGGNLMSFDLPLTLWREAGVKLIHTHALNRIGGIGLTIARMRGIPLVVSIHGGALTLPPEATAYIKAPLRGGFEWGRIFGIVLRSRKVIEQADAIVTLNKMEASLLREKYPRQRVLLQPHGVPIRDFEQDCRKAAIQAFPELAGKAILLIAGRIDPVKNQLWAVSQCRSLFQRVPNLTLVLAGGGTDPHYAKAIRSEIQRQGLENRVLLTGPLPPGDPRLIGLFQKANALVVPSLTETFGLVILEAWAAATPVLSSRNPGALDLIKPGENGWLFDLHDPATFHAAARQALSRPDMTRRLGRAGHALVKKQYDSILLAGQVKGFYEELIESKQRGKGKAGL